MGASGVTSLLIGAFTIINTMVVSIQERRREIGLKKAVGAEDGDILAEILMAAGRLGIAGGVVGVGMAWITTLVLNPIIREQIGVDILHLSPRLAAGSVLFSLLLGAVAGLLPARRAARLDPVIALHAE